MYRQQRFGRSAKPRSNDDMCASKKPKKNRLWQVWGDVFRIRRGLRTESVWVRAPNEKQALRLGKIKLRLPKDECPPLRVMENTASSPCR